MPNMQPGTAFMTWYNNVNEVHEMSTCGMRRYVHTAVGEGNGVSVAGHTLLLTVVGAGGRSHSITSVDIVRVDGLPTWCMPGREGRETRHAKKKTIRKQAARL